ncbi:hypothetical protein HanIR_Chr15g0780611 [Helianthus annuus]|nr:hypothetical protein HanIR_Chr15g0780611 [Helianthus annuus]
MALQLQNVESLKATSLTKVEVRVLHTQSTRAMIFQHPQHISEMKSITNS